MPLTVLAGELVFEDPIRLWAPQTLAGAVAALEQVDDALDRGLWIAGGFTYEFGAQLHGIGSHTAEPLFVLGAFDEPRSAQASAAKPFAMSAPLSRVPRERYEAGIGTILRSIGEGEVYQVNYTVPFDVGFNGEPVALYERLSSQANAPYSALLQYGSTAVVSISPELFLRFEGGTLTAKPMKGTAPLDRMAELHDDKNRAEHLMIVDLLRNDLHKLCSRVQVDPLFEVERYPTFATMTSTVRGRSNTTLRFAGVIKATFPCGSVTGAPKRAAMEHIARIEQYPRGFYTGSIGYLSPQRCGWWNVAIRTIQIDSKSGAARFDAGGGIVADSAAAAEWDEIAIKSRFLAPAFEDFTIWETFASDAPDERLNAHLERLVRTAGAFNMPCDAPALRACIPSGAQAQLVRARANAAGVTASAEPLQEPQTPVLLCFADGRVHSADPFLRHKTAWRPAHDQAAHQAQRQGCFDAILCNERGEITEGTRTTIFAQFGNTLYTPPLECGLLPGILRAELLCQGRVSERVLTKQDIERADKLFVGNSARGLLAARMK